MNKRIAVPSLDELASENQDSPSTFKKFIPGASANIKASSASSSTSPIDSNAAGSVHSVGCSSSSANIIAPATKTMQPPPVSTNLATIAGRSGNTIVVNPRQRGNPVLKYIRNQAWEFGDADARLAPDFILGRSACAFFLSLRFHKIQPDYIHERLKIIRSRNFSLVVLLVQMDSENAEHLLRELNKMCQLAAITLLLAWSPEEVARYLELYKAYEYKPPDLILGRQEDLDDRTSLVNLLTSVRSINKSDAITLIGTFGSLAKIAEATEAQLAECPGVGPLKAKKLYMAFREKFVLDK